MELRCKGRVEVENRGYITELFAENESVLSRLLPDLAVAWSKQQAEVDVSRIYGRDGIIQDPRTGVTSNRIKRFGKAGWTNFWKDGEERGVNFFGYDSKKYLLHLPSFKTLGGE